MRDTATIDITATVEGNVTAQDCDINGLVKGNVFCSNNLFLGRLAIIEGSIMAKKAIMESGCRINGTVVLAPKVEISTLAVKIIEAEMILKGKEKLENQEIFAKKANIPQKRVSIPNVKTVNKEKKRISIQKPDLNLTQEIGNDDNWW